MKAFVTGGTGFIGSRVVQKLLERGYQVVALARSESGAAALRAAGAEIAIGDITDSDSMRAGMTGCDVVFHVAGWYKLGSNDWMAAETINVGGTRKVLKLAVELGIPKIIYTSTVAVLGDTKGQLVDENYYNDGPFLSEYDRTKWLAHYKVALSMIQKGAPVIIVMPGGVYGPGDHSLIAEVMGMFLRGFPLVTGPETTLTFAHVDDIAEGHILAAEKGKIGESYVLAGPAVPLGEMMDFWAYLTGRRSPTLRIPAKLLRPVAPLMGVVGSLVTLPPAYSQEVINSLGATYMARADKARSELGWQPRPLQAGMLETFDWFIKNTPPTPVLSESQRKLAIITLLGTAVVFLLWLLGRKRK